MNTRPTTIVTERMKKVREEIAQLDADRHKRLVEDERIHDIQVGVFSLVVGAAFIAIVVLIFMHPI